MGSEMCIRDRYEQYGEVKKDLKVYCVIKQNTAKVTNTGRACAEDV